MPAARAGLAGAVISTHGAPHQVKAACLAFARVPRVVEDALRRGYNLKRFAYHPRAARELLEDAIRLLSGHVRKGSGERHAMLRDREFQIDHRSLKPDSDYSRTLEAVVSGITGSDVGATDGLPALSFPEIARTAA